AARSVHRETQASETQIGSARDVRPISVHGAGRSVRALEDMRKLDPAMPFFIYIFRVVYAHSGQPYGATGLLHIIDRTVIAHISSGEIGNGGTRALPLVAYLDSYRRPLRQRAR